jgi:hypothetical protein
MLASELESNAWLDGRSKSRVAKQNIGAHHRGTSEVLAADYRDTDCHYTDCHNPDCHNPDCHSKEKAASIAPTARFTEFL